MQCSCNALLLPNENGPGRKLLRPTSCMPLLYPVAAAAVVKGQGAPLMPNRRGHPAATSDGRPSQTDGQPASSGQPTRSTKPAAVPSGSCPHAPAEAVQADFLRRLKVQAEAEAGAEEGSEERTALKSANRQDAAAAAADAAVFAADGCAQSREGDSAGGDRTEKGREEGGGVAEPRPSSEDGQPGSKLRGMCEEAERGRGVHGQGERGVAEWPDEEEAWQAMMAAMGLGSRQQGGEWERERGVDREREEWSASEASRKDLWEPAVVTIHQYIMRAYEDLRYGQVMRLMRA